MPEKPLILNVRHLETQVVRFEGELEWGSLELGAADELVHPVGGVAYRFCAERHEQGILLQGKLDGPVYGPECNITCRSGYFSGNDFSVNGQWKINHINDGRLKIRIPDILNRFH